MDNDDWGLFAIVRSCKAATFTATTNTQTPPTTTSGPRSPNTTTTTNTFTVNQENVSFSFPNLVQQRTNGFQELQQLLMNFNPTTTTNTISSTTTTITSGLRINPNSTFSDVAGFNGQHQLQQIHHHHMVPVPTNHTSIGTPSTSSFHRFQQQPQQQQPQQNQSPQKGPVLSPKAESQTPRSRKRRNQQKKTVCHVTVDNLSADSWAWRKYGQKPIKGSPYPRNYYRCSSCKGCAARKQVERSNTEPNTFIVTYTGEHKHAKPIHRNSLAGSTRNKPSTTGLPENTEPGSSLKKENASSSSSALSPTPENDSEIPASEPDGPEFEIESDDHSEDDDVLIPNTGVMSDSVLLG